MIKSFKEFALHLAVEGVETLRPIHRQSENVVGDFVAESFELWHRGPLH